jgi:response regulator RpfG family c-di-GMP phosphodiesterase
MKSMDPAEGNITPVCILGHRRLAADSFIRTVGPQNSVARMAPGGERFRGSIMAEKVLFVDDELLVLDGYKRMLYKEFEVEIAVGGEQALNTMRLQGPYAVVVSDMRMPGMSGAQFLAQVRQVAPDTVRMLLTGYTDLSAAMDAVNDGNIFRFLTKPCEKETLAKALTTGFVQYRLVTAEKELLENTLMGSIKVLADVLGVASPEAFGRSLRIAHLVRHLVGKFGKSSPWRFEAAAMLSQLGCVTLAPEVIQTAYRGEVLSPEDQARFDTHPKIARDLLVNIPRLEPVAWIISQQLSKGLASALPGEPSSQEPDIVFGANALKLAIAFDKLRMNGISDEDAVRTLHGRSSEFDPKMVEGLIGIKTEGPKLELRKVQTAKLARGMILQQEIRNQAGMLVVAKGQEITQALVVKLQNLSVAGTIDKEVMALVSVQPKS